MCGVGRVRKSALLRAVRTTFVQLMRTARTAPWSHGTARQRAFTHPTDSAYAAAVAANRPASTVDLSTAAIAAISSPESGR
jgi:hypothetical protein